MRKRFLILIPILIVAILAGICLWIAPSSGPQPVYQGKPLNYWLAGYDQDNYRAAHPHGPTPPSQAEADKAIDEMGANAIPALMRMLQARDSKFKASIIRMLGKQPFLNSLGVPENENFKALQAFMELGSEAAPAIPRLIRMFEQDSSAFSQQSIPVILGNMHSAAEPAIPMLLRAASHTNEFVRNNAVRALGQVRGKPKLMIPVLTQCLKDTNAFVQAQAASALGQFRNEAQPAFSALLQLWQKTTNQTATGCSMGTYISISWTAVQSLSGKPDVAKSAKEALQLIDPEAAARARVE